jgi:hypothetical protein
VLYSGIPGTSSLLPNEGTLMFTEERDEIEAQDKIVDIFRDIHDILQGSLSMTSHLPASSGAETPSKSQLGTKPPNQKIINKYLQHYDAHNANNKRRINSDVRANET